MATVSDTTTSTPIDAAGIRRTLRETRQRLAISFDAASERSGLHKSTIVRIEAGESVLYIHHVHPLCRAYNVAIRDLVAGHPPGPFKQQDTGAVIAHVRTRLRETRTKAGVGARALAVKSGVHKTTIFRLESGQYEGLDLEVVDRLARALGTTAAAWLRGIPAA